MAAADRLRRARARDERAKRSFHHSLYPAQRIAARARGRACRCACPRASARATVGRDRRARCCALREPARSTRSSSSTPASARRHRGDRRGAPGRACTRRPSCCPTLRAGARQGRRDVARAVGARRRARLLPRRRHRGLLRALRHRPARAARVRAAACRSSRASTGARSSTAACRCRRGRRARQPPAWRGRRSRCSTPSSPPCASRSRARSPRGASCSSGVPFATGYGVEIAMLIDVWRERRPGGRSRRSIWTSTATATSRSRRSTPMAAHRARDDRRRAGARKGGCADVGRSAAPAVERPPLGERRCR